MKLVLPFAIYHIHQDLANGQVKEAPDALHWFNVAKIDGGAIQMQID